jgi:hypothetical protein
MRPIASPRRSPRAPRKRSRFMPIANACRNYRKENVAPDSKRHVIRAADDKHAAKCRSEHDGKQPSRRCGVGSNFDSGFCRKPSPSHGRRAGRHRWDRHHATHGGAGIRGWISSIYNKLSGTITIGGIVSNIIANPFRRSRVPLTRQPIRKTI